MVAQSEILEPAQNRGVLAEFLQMSRVSQREEGLRKPCPGGCGVRSELHGELLSWLSSESSHDTTSSEEPMSPFARFWKDVMQT